MLRPCLSILRASLPFRRSRPVVVLGLVFLVGVGCSPEPAPEPPAPEPAALPEPAPEPEPEPEPAAHPDPDALERVLEEAATHETPGAWTEAVLAELTLPQKVGQMIMPWVLGDFSPEGSASFQRMAEMIDRHEIGGVIMSVGTPMDVATKTNLFQRRSNLPLLVSADLETGAGFRMRGAVHLPGAHDLGGATNFPSLMAVGATGEHFLAYEMGRITALEARAVGVHLPFAPVLDVNNNPDNPIINTRSFGEDPAQVGALGACFVRGVQAHGAIATGKHFPGHGDTETDSHLALPVIQVERDRLESVELRPFRDAIEAGIGAIMTAHIAMPGVTEDDRLPATLSRNVLTGLLRQEMGFDGLVVTDALDMNAIDRLYSREEAAAQAVLAGADILLMPPDPGAAIRGVVEAVLSGRISEARIDDSVRRILRQKEALGLHRERTVELEAVHRTVGIPAHLERARDVAERSLTLLKNDGGLLPLLGTRSADVVSVTYRRQNDLMGGRAFDQRLRQTYPGLETRTIGQATEAREYDRILERARRSDLVVLSLHVTAVAYAGDVAVPEALAELVESLAREGIPHVVVSFGNPYLLREFPRARAYLLAWSGSEASQRAAAGALFGDVPVGGSTPTRIPPDFEIGDGLTLGTPATALVPSARTPGTPTPGTPTGIAGTASPAGGLCPLPGEDGP
jgi:beta-N-acetylhexosaminidase